MESGGGSELEESMVKFQLSDSFDCTRIESIVSESNTRHSVTVSRQNRENFGQVLDIRGETIFL